MAQYEVAKAQPAEGKASDSPRKGGFCHRPWAPWLHAESWKKAYRSKNCLVAAEDLPTGANAGLERCPIRGHARRPTHAILISNEKLPGSRNVVGQPSVGFSDRSRHIPGQAKIESERWYDPPIVLHERTPDCPAAAGDGTIERLVMNGQASEAEQKIGLGIATNVIYQGMSGWLNL